MSGPAEPVPAAATGGPAPDDEFVAVDWGTTHLRLRLLDGSPMGAPPAGAAGPGGVIAETRSDEGIASVAAGEHQRVFLESLERLLAPAGRQEAWRARGGDVYFSGMVTSTLGWFPTPYLRVPAGPREILSASRVESLQGLQLHFFPGLRTEDDVLRGEEVEAIGLFGSGAGGGAGPRVLVLPGTHSKWIRWEEGRIAGFTTVLTGDLHAALHRSTLLARTLPPSPAAVEGLLLEPFERGVDLAREAGPLASLFKARALPVLSGMAPEAASALLSGVLIAGEVLERTAREGVGAPVLLAGAPPLRELYRRAFTRLWIPVDLQPAELAARASAEGLRLLRALSRSGEGDRGKRAGGEPRGGATARPS